MICHHPVDRGDDDSVAVKKRLNLYLRFHNKKNHNLISIAKKFAAEGPQ
jgi:hypothetical protein